METSNTINKIYGLGIAHTTKGGEVLDVWYPELSESQIENPKLEEKLAKLISQYNDPADALRKTLVKAKITVNEAPTNTEDAYLRLHALSNRLVKPNEINIDNIFGLLPNNVWTNFGPYPVKDFELTRAALIAEAPVTIYGVDKFPRMVDYVLPSGIRIADADRVRLGAYVAEGTTVMHEGFINFNAGTLGTCMVEGRISAGVVVEDGSDIGGGASIMGTLSGGGKEHVSIGKNSLLGANSGVGISIGDDCVVEAGLYITSGSKITLITKDEKKTAKGAELSGVNNLLFIRNSVTGAIEARSRKSGTVELNEQLHAN
ncbi:MAG: 2,3,4,5-tetrahydropyridine-2,6-dicarboxylate N-succinyltransferase [Micrococcaceae bacterium]